MSSHTTKIYQDLTRDQRIANAREHYETRASRRTPAVIDPTKYDVSNPHTVGFPLRLFGSETLKLRAELSGAKN